MDFELTIMQRETIKINEDGVELSLPKESLVNPFKAAVFYNPRMRFSRSLSALAVSALKPKRIADGLCASGVRGLRCAKGNSSVQGITFIDSNPIAIEFAKQNAQSNSLDSKSSFAWKDFLDFAVENNGKFDFVEIDPFGTPAPFVESALACLKKTGVLSLTATDLANLVKKNAPTLRDYAAKPVYNDFSHETSLRIIIGFVARKAAELKLGVKPLLCFYEGHHAKAIIQLTKTKEKKLDFVSYCDKCLSRFDGKKAECVCGNRLLYAGPLWTGDFCDKAFLKKLIALNEKRNYADKKRISKTLELLVGDQGFPPWFFDVHATADFFGLPAGRRIDDIVEKLRSDGFKATRTHFTPLGIKTNADAVRVKGVI